MRISELGAIFIKTRKLSVLLGVASLSASAMALVGATATPSKAVIVVNSAFDTPNCVGAPSRANGGSTQSGGCADTAPWAASGTVGSANPALTSQPNYVNAIAAETRFLANLVGVTTQTFQGFAENSTPNTLAFGTVPNQIIASLISDPSGGDSNGGSGTGTPVDNANYSGTVQSSGGGAAGQGQYGVAPNTQCNPGGDPRTCLNSQQNLPIAGNTVNAAQKFLRITAGSTASPQSFIVDFTAHNTNFPTNQVAAFGFYGIDVGDQGGGLSLLVNATYVGGVAQPGTGTLTTVLGATAPLLRRNDTVAGQLGCGTALPNNTAVNSNNYYANCNGAVLFYGVVGFGGEVINTVQFISSTAGGTEIFAFDNFTVGGKQNLIPAPFPLAGLLPLGVAFKSMGKKRRNLLAARSQPDPGLSTPV
jgi:hypothetical protein